MPYLTKDEVVVMLKERRHREVVDQHLIAGIPFVFQDEPDLFQSFAGYLGAGLRTPPTDITIIGSARIGFSLSPDKFGNPFSSASDIDVVVVDAEKFDIAWVQLGRLGRKYIGLSYKVKLAYETHKTNNVFFGYLEPGRLPGIVTLSNLWFRTFQSAGSHKGLSSFEINGRLYRSWEHVKTHQLYSLESIAVKLKL